MLLLEENHILQVVVSSGKELEYLVPKQRMKATVDGDVVHFESFSEKDVVKFISDNIISKNIIELNDFGGDPVYLNASQITQFKIL